MPPKKAMKAMKVGLGKPTKVMKTTMKAKAGKNPLEKGKQNHTQNKLNKTNLEKLGKMSLDDKIQQAATEGESTEEQAIVLKGMLRKDEHSKLWGRYKTHLEKIQMRKKKLTFCQKKTKASRQPSG